MKYGIVENGPQRYVKSYMGTAHDMIVDTYSMEMRMTGMSKIKKISLIGLGAMGVYFAPRLANVYGKNFRIIAGGSRKERLETKGVTLNGKNYKFSIVTPEQTGDTADLIIVGVKGYALDQAIEDMKNQVGEHTLIMSLLNGVDSEDKLIQHFGEDHVIYCYMRTSIVMKDGVADFDPDKGMVHFGEKMNGTKDAPEYSERILAVKDVMDQAGIPYEIDEDMIRGIWFKYMCNVGENLTCALLGIPFGGFRISHHANWIRENAMREVLAIANKKGINLSEDDIVRQDGTVKKLPFPNKPSTLQDLEGGKHTEVDMFAGRVIQMGKELGIPTPICEMFYHGISVFEEKNDGLIHE